MGYTFNFLFFHIQVEGVKAEIKLTEEVERILDAEVHSNEKIKVIPKMVDMLKKKVSCVTINSI